MANVVNVKLPEPHLPRRPPPRLPERVVRDRLPIVVNSHGKPVRLSTDLDAYGPACTRHNAQLDYGGNWTLCPHGHVRAVWGTDSKGTCRGCNRLGRKTSGQQVGSIAHIVSIDNTERGRS